MENYKEILTNLGKLENSKIVKPNIEVGGNHYNMTISPIEYIEANNLPFCEGNIIKYVSRHPNKNKDEDIQKIISYSIFILKYTYKYSAEQLKSVFNKFIN